MKSGLKRLGDFVRIRTGKLDANEGDPNGAYPFFTCAQAPLRITSYSYDCECVLVAGNGDLNVKYHKGKFDAYQRTYIIESTDSQQLDVRYLFRFMERYVEKLRAMSIGGVIKYIKLAYLTDAQIPLPRLTAQQRIAATLDQADALRAKRSYALTKLDTLTQSLFLDLFGDPEGNSRKWPTVELCQLVRGDDTINYGVQPGDETPDGIPLVRVGDFLGGEIELGQLKRISPDIEAAYERSRLRGDEILISCVGSIGNVAVCRPEMKGMNIARAVARIPVDSNKADRAFLAEYLRMAFVQRFFSSETRTVSQPTLNIRQILETPVRLPPLPRQCEFAERATVAGRVRLAQTTSRSKLDSLFASLQHRAFRGEL